MRARFPFVQFEFAQSLGPPAGRYVVSNGAAANGRPELGSADVLVIAARGARPSVKRRPQQVAPGEPPRDLSVTLATVIRGTRMLDGDAAAGEFMRRVRRSGGDRESWVQAGLAVVNRAVAAYRACAADPYVVEVTRVEPRAVVLGYGPAEQVYAGLWEEAISVPPPRAQRLTRGVRLLPSQGVAAALAGHGDVLESEQLLLHALLDLEQGRPRAAAVALEAACGLLAAELRERGADEPPATDGVAELAQRARSGALDEAAVAALHALAEAAGALIDNWRYRARE